MARTTRLLVHACLPFITAIGHAQISQPLSRPVEITLGQAASPIYGPWKFSVGDSPIDSKTDRPLWAEPGFDDSGWETVDLTPRPGMVDPWTNDPRFVPGWTSLGHPGYMGWAWYRIAIRVSAPKEERLAVEGPYWADDAYQVFDNGGLLGSFGKFSSADETPAVYFNQPAFFPLPREIAGDIAGGPEKYVLAFRVWMGPVGVLHGTQPGGLHYAPFFGRYQAVAAQYRLEQLELFLGNCFPIFESALFLLLGIVAVSLIFIDRTDPLYPWVAGVSLFAAAMFGLGSLASISQWGGSSRMIYFIFVTCSPIILGGWMMVWWVWFRLRRPAWVPKAIVALTLAGIVAGIVGESFLPGAHPHVVAVNNQVSNISGLLSMLLLLLIFGEGIRRTGLTGWLAMPAIVPLAVSLSSSEFPALGLSYLWHPFGITVNTVDLANVLMTLSISVLLFRRFLFSIRRERRMALDLKQAQEVQEVILPEHRIVVPGLEIESEYRPALEVGGDFFQIIPNRSDSSLLIVAGDVAGKGLRAGMLVALLVGAIRSTAEIDPEPVAILAALNRRLLGRGDARATCLAMRIGKDGSVKLANAGHLPPYLNETPVEIEGSLPLGLMEGCDYSEFEFRLSPNDRLLLVSDGVPEATDTNGTLFGFDRVLELVRTHPTATKIAETAQAFGQEDDISVIAVKRVAVAEPALV